MAGRNFYETTKTVAEGEAVLAKLLLLVALLKAFLNPGEGVDINYVAVVFIAISVAVKAALAIVLIIRGKTKDEEGADYDDFLKGLNVAGIVLFSISLVLDTVTAGLGITELS